MSAIKLIIISPLLYMYIFSYALFVHSILILAVVANRIRWKIWRGHLHESVHSNYCRNEAMLPT